MKIASKIRRFRLEKGFSQDYMSIQLGISQKTYRRIENGESKIDIKRLQEISKILDVDPMELIDTEDMPVFNSFQQQGGNANIYVQALSDKEKKLYDDRIKHLESEILFLRDLLDKLKKRF